MKSNFTNVDKRIGLFLLIILFGSVLLKVQSQSLGEIKGTVYDSSNNTGLADVNVQVKGSATRGLTNVNGQYSIRASSTNVLVFSFVSFKNEEIPVGNGSVVNVVLKGSATRLGEVVVNVGYGTNQYQLIADYFYPHLG